VSAADVLGHAGVPSATFTSKPRCMAVHAAMNERRDHHLAPAADNDTESVLDEAINSLARLRAMEGGATLASIFTFSRA